MIKTKTRFKPGVLEIIIYKPSEIDKINMGDLVEFSDIPEIFKVTNVRLPSPSGHEECCGVYKKYGARPIEIIKLGDDFNVKSFKGPYNFDIGWDYIPSRKRKFA